MDNLIAMMEEMGIPFAYDHFAEGESPEPPFICFLSPGSDNFAADGRVYFKVRQIHIELYTDEKNPETESWVETVLDGHGIFMTGPRSGSRAKSSTKSYILLSWRYPNEIRSNTI